MQKTKNHEVILTEITPLEKTQFLYLRDSEPETFSFPLHRHEEYELNFIEHCKGRRRIVGDSMEELGDSELILIGPKLEHAWEQPEGVPPSKMREVTIQFSPRLIGEDLLEKEHFASIRELLQRSERGVTFGPGAILRAYALIDTLAHAEKGFYRYIRLLELLYQLSNETDYRLLSSSQFAQAEVSGDSRRINKVMAYLNEHFRDEVRLPQLADNIGMTPTAFSRYFSQHTGKSLTDFLVDKRIGYAARRLVDSRDTVAEVCYDSGFSTLSNFNKAFKARRGCTPKVFRENYRKKKVVID